MRRTLACVLFSLSALPLAPAQIIPPGYMIIEEDLMVPVDWYVAESTHAGTSWTNGVVPFRFDTSGTGAVSAANQTAMLVAMAEWEAVADVDFVPWTNQNDRIFITDSGANGPNSSMLGKQGGEQVVNISTPAFGSRFVMCHELGHALGLHHEQSRPDRDNFVTINWGVINIENWIQFAADPFANTFGSYDFDSMMHYGQLAFSNNGQPSITCNAGFTQFQTTIGQRAHLSLLDAQGMADRYGSPPAPSISSISPSTATVGGASFTLTVNGSKFLSGRIDSSGVQGTRVRINGTVVTTTFVSPTQVQATVSSTLIDDPGTLTVQVENPSPGGGNSNSVSLAVTCPGNPLALAGGAETTITTNCTDWSITPSSNQWNVVGLSSSSDWHVHAGTVVSTAGSANTNFVLANDRNGTISPTNGSFRRNAGINSGVALHYTAIDLTVDTPFHTNLHASSPFLAYEFNVSSAGNHVVGVTGDGSLNWRLYSPGTTAAWRPRSDSITSGIVGGTPQTENLGTGWHCLVVYRNGGVAATQLPVTAVVMSSTATTGGSGTISVTPTRFVTTPTAGAWNCVGVGSADSNWHLVLGNGESQFNLFQTNFVLANGHEGSITHDEGFAYRFSGTTSATLQSTLRSTLTIGTTFNASAWTSLHRLFEFEVTTPDSYDLTVTGTGGRQWRLYDPGTSGAWRGRGSFNGFGSEGGGTVTATLGAGWHALVIFKDGGPDTSMPAFTVLVTPTPNPVPVLTSISPVSAPAGSAALTLTCTGSGFLDDSVVRWNGANLATTFVSATQLAAAVPASLLATPGAASVTVFNPAPGGGTSAVRTFNVNHLVPALTSIGPASATAGGAAFTLVVTGTGFDGQSVVRWAGSNRTTTFFSGTLLHAAIGAADIAAAGTFAVTVVNPAPGGGTSGASSFTVNNPAPAVAGLNPASTLVGGPAFTLTVNGANFNGQSVVRWNGSPRTTTLVSSTQVTAAIPASDIAAAGSAAVSVNNPAPGGGTSGSSTFTVNNPVPVLASVSPSSVVAGGPAFTITVTGTGFVSGSVVRWNGSNRTTTFQGPTQLQAAIPASDIAAGATAQVSVRNGTPGGGISASLAFTVDNPLPAITSIAPGSAVCGGAGFSLTVDGTGFVPTSTVRWNGATRLTVFVNATRVTAAILPSDLLVSGPAAVTVRNPAPAGGTSAPASFTVAGPAITALVPASIAVLPPGAAPFAVSVQGTGFVPGVSQVCANGVMLAPSSSTTTQLTVTLDPAAVPQATRPGAIAFTVQNAAGCVSNTRPLVVGTGINRGTIRRQPLAPAPGEAYAAVIETSAANEIFTLVVDLTNPAPVAPWPDPSVNMVLSVLPGSPGLLPLLDGIGLFSPSTGVAFGPTGAFSLSGFVAPNPPVGIDLTVQAIYLDATSPFGFNLTWARWPDRL